MRGKTGESGGHTHASGTRLGPDARARAWGPTSRLRVTLTPSDRITRCQPSMAEGREGRIRLIVKVVTVTAWPKIDQGYPPRARKGIDAEEAEMISDSASLQR